MLVKSFPVLLVVGISLVVVTGGHPAELTIAQRKDLIVFAMKAMGTNVGVQDVKDPLTSSEVETLVATGLNLNGHLCARVVSVRPLQLKSK
jgi:hypothetical protein